jgi:hypothetical protein
MCVTKYYFVSSKLKERADGSLMISTSKGFNHAKKLAKSRFKTYGYKGRLVNIHPFSTMISKVIAI